MSGTGLTERTIIGRYFWRLEQDASLAWVPKVSSLFQTDHVTHETIRFLGAAPAMVEWAGERQARELFENEVVVLLSDYEATESFTLDEFVFDKTDQINARIDELALVANSHWGDLWTDLVSAGETTDCYDGLKYFATNHVQGDSGSQSNLLTTASITDPQNPGDAVVEKIIRQSVKKILGLKDDKGKLMNENARAFSIMCPVGLHDAVTAAVYGEQLTDGGATRTGILTQLQKRGISFDVIPNGRLDNKGSSGTTWYGATASRIIVSRADAPVSGVIRFQNLPAAGPGVTVSALGPASEHAWKTKKVLFSADAKRGISFGYWQNSVLHKITT